MLGYVDFSRYLFVVFMGILVLNQVLFYGVLQRVFVALFERISPCLAQNRARFIGFLPPCHRVFRSQIGVFRCLAHFNIATKEVCWLVGSITFFQTL